MFHINRAKNGEFYISARSHNGKIVNGNETFKTRQGCYRNIMTQGNFFIGGFPGAYIQDNTRKKPVVLWLKIVGPPTKITAGIAVESTDYLKKK